MACATAADHGRRTPMVAAAPPTGMARLTTTDACLARMDAPPAVAVATQACWPTWNTDQIQLESLPSLREQLRFQECTGTCAPGQNRASASARVGSTFRIARKPLMSNTSRTCGCMAHSTS